MKLELYFENYQQKSELLKTWELLPDGSAGVTFSNAPQDDLYSKGVHMFGHYISPSDGINFMKAVADKVSHSSHLRAVLE